MTRSGEDYWEDSWDDNDYSDLDINDLEYLGEGVYTDGNGHYYIDIDYDGDIDLETIAPGHVEEEMPEEPDIPDTPEPKPDPEPDTGDGNDDEFPEDDSNVGDNPVVNNSIVSAQEMFAASQYSVNKVTELYGPIKAYCNQGVIIAFNQVFPDLQLPNVCANDLVHYWQQHPGNWTLITMQQAIQSADEGYFVVAGWINDKGSGHVAVVMPAETVKGTWNGVYTDVPQVMDTGFERRETCISICRCFGRDKHDNVEFYKFVK